LDNYLIEREKIGTKGTDRRYFWLSDAQPSLVRSSSLLRARLETSRNFRLGVTACQRINLPLPPDSSLKSHLYFGAKDVSRGALS
jgi:hypothetical protein